MQLDISETEIAATAAELREVISLLAQGTASKSRLETPFSLRFKGGFPSVLYSASDLPCSS